MKYLPVAFASIVVVEIFLRLSVVHIITRLPVILKKAIRVVSSRRISDHWKEKVLLRYAGMIAIISFELAAIISIVFATIMLLSLLFDHVFKPHISMLDVIVTWPGFTVAAAVSFAYVIVRHHLVPE